ncbi:hypothetical protein CDL12_13400 [Handroanthus impetiginosus]|uniref:Uncharacterized protein n=1 Tax=Handroanthus impetiginosus TaxID=429701 RepID=A0A2G9H8Z0_9LAMI|nr:hypothetical protein CDL12_13400 [Handroanthus impetiginosus]
MEIPISPVESNLKGLAPDYIADIYLNNNFSPIFGSKNLNYYQAILKETHSVVIEVTDRSNKDIAFSKFLIRKEDFFTRTVLKDIHGFSGLIQFTIYYDIPWILKWNYRIFCKIEKKFSIQITEPYLFRQNYLRWWNKFDCFDKEAVYTKRGVITLTPPTAPSKQPQSTPQLSLKDMLAGLSQEEAMKLFAKTFGVQIGKDKGKRPMSPYQDSQDPYEEDSDDSLMELTQHLGKS